MGPLVMDEISHFNLSKVTPSMLPLKSNQLEPFKYDQFR